MTRVIDPPVHRLENQHHLVLLCNGGGPLEGLRRLGERWEVHAVEVMEPPDFFAVGQFYSDFAQVSDQEVADLPRESDSPQRV